MNKVIKNYTIKTILDLVEQRKNYILNIEADSEDKVNQKESLLKHIESIQNRLHLCQQIQKGLCTSTMSNSMRKQYQVKKKLLLSTIIKTIKMLKL
ncbi:hypothetical protein AB837_00157 [bacterium AB1]|nr:hypothetical protein AB837_00157 [bacterium AB1]